MLAAVRATAAVLVVKVVGLGMLIGFRTGFLGVGGGFLAVPALVIALRLPMAGAIGTSLLVIALNSTAGLADRFSGPVLATAFSGMLLAVGAVVAVESVLALSG
ncbi:TSUP family transporter [Pseudonocardia sp. GCM10023141]|uniref:TSUP family transporter n=1 Tax=Pseudonocardia sp. GCM10023141 TaxID=3252653 RepID=UPI003613FC54